MKLHSQRIRFRNSLKCLNHLRFPRHISMMHLKWYNQLTSNHYIPLQLWRYAPTFLATKGRNTLSTHSSTMRCWYKGKTQAIFAQNENFPVKKVKVARPFINFGVDYWGPTWIHYKCRCKKPPTNLCCRILFSRKAVHIGVVIDLTTETIFHNIPPRDI